jgi:hypothetical protein
MQQAVGIQAMKQYTWGLHTIHQRAQWGASYDLYDQVLNNAWDKLRHQSECIQAQGELTEKNISDGNPHEVAQLPSILHNRNQIK